MGATILIIDDDRELCALLAEFLQLDGFATNAVHDGAAAVDHCRGQSYDAIVLDIMLPGLQGLEVLRSLRRFSSTPVLMLTARGEDTDRIVGLEMGADDYLPKPCNPRELAARLRAILRRSTAGPDAPHEKGQELVVGHTRLNSAQRSATYAGTDLGLTAAEFNVLAALLARALDSLQPARDDRALDLFSGIGNFSLPLAGRVKTVHALEGDSGMTRRLATNAERNGIRNIAARTLNLITGELELPPADIAIVDPPRAGAKAVCEALARSQVKRLVYISCHPATLLRDARILHGAGFSLARAAAVDMFPHTGHSEAITLFQRKPKRQGKTRKSAAAALPVFQG